MRRHTTLACVTSLAVLLAAGKPALALTITPQFGSSITGNANATQIEGAISAAISQVEGLYTNPINITVNYTYTPGPFNILESTNGSIQQYSYSQYVTALTADSALNPGNTALAQAVTNLPKGNDSNGALGIAAQNTQAYMLSAYGLTAPTMPTVYTTNINSNSNFGFSNPISSTQFDLTGGIEHELNEILGGGNGGSVLNAVVDNGTGCQYPYACSDVGPLDLYRYSAKNTPTLSTSPTATAYLSLDGGATKLAGFNQNSTYDLGDFGPAGTGAGEYIQNAFNNPGQYEAYANAAPEYQMMEALGWDPTHPCNVECYNGFATPPKKSAKKFTIVLAGNVTAQINTAETGIDTLVNPFAYVNQVLFNGAGTSSANVTFDGTNTVITYTGTEPLLPGYNYTFGSNPHFGYEGTEAIAPPTIGKPPTLPLDLLGEYYTYADGTTDQQPTLGLGCEPGGSGSEYVIFFSDVTLNGETTGEWNECQGTGVTLTNPTGGDETLSDAGYYLSDTSIPLDLLNFGNFPPPDQAGSVFTDLPGLDGSVLAAGASEGVDVPEPSSMALLAVGVMGLLARRRRRR